MMTVFDAMICGVTARLSALTNVVETLFEPGRLTTVWLF